MDQSAIKRIEELAAATVGTPVTDVPVLLSPSGCDLHSLEAYMDAPRQAKRTFKTERLEDFCRYVTAEAVKADTAAFVEPDGSGALAVIDFGSHDKPKWGRHRAVLTMRHTSEFAALLQICNQPLSQRAITDYIEDWSHILQPKADGKDMHIAAAIEAIRKVDIKATAKSSHEEGDFRAARTAMEEIEARAAKGSMPGVFSVDCQVYPCTKVRRVRARLSLLTGADEPRLKLRILGQDALMKEVAEEVELELAERLTGVRVFVGSV